MKNFFAKIIKFIKYRIKNLISGRESLSKFFVYYNNNLKNLKYDYETIQILKKSLKPDSVCVDVGAHKGDILKMMLKYAPKGKHYAFEPIPHLHQFLQKKFGKKAHILKIALSDKKGKTAFNYVETNPSYSGFKKRAYDFPDEKEKIINVETDLLDNIIPASQKIDLIKIDVEGAELQVLKGAVKTISRCKPLIVFEHGLGAADFYETRPEEVYDLLEKCGLKISLMEHYLSDKESLDKSEFFGQFHKRYNYYFIAHI